MKRKSLIAGAAILSLTGAAYAQSSVTLYGLIDAGLTYTNSQITGLARVDTATAR